MRTISLKVLVVGALLLTLSAGVAVAVINGGSTGPDFIQGTDNPDQLFGQADADTINGAGGRDAIFGGNGADKLNGQAGGDVIVGGLGADEIRLENASASGNEKDFVDAQDGEIDTLIDCGGVADGDRIQMDTGDKAALKNCPGVSEAELLASPEFVVNVN